MRRLLLILVSVLLFWPATMAMEQDSTAVADTATVANPDTATVANSDTIGWFKALKKGRVNFDDPLIHYPRMMRLGWNCYLWYKRTLNTQDTTYVGSTNTLWRVMLKNENWVDNYDLYPLPNLQYAFQSGLTCNIGAYFSIAGISLGYSVDWNRIVGSKPTSKKLEFGINNAKFTIEYHHTTNVGDMTFKVFDNESHTRDKYKNFEGMRRRSWGLNAYYFFNNRKYSQGAAYAVSRIQRRSAGSALAGFNITHQNFSFDRDLVKDWEALGMTYDEMDDETLFVYTDYCLSGGYAYNWVLGKNWLLNGTALVQAGLKHAHAHATSDGGSNFFGINSKLRASVVYRTRGFFVTGQGYLDTRFFNTGPYRFRSFFVDFSVMVGFDF